MSREVVKKQPELHCRWRRFFDLIGWDWHFFVDERIGNHKFDMAVELERGCGCCPHRMGVVVLHATKPEHFIGNFIFKKMYDGWHPALDKYYEASEDDWKYRLDHHVFDGYLFLGANPSVFFTSMIDCSVSGGGMSSFSSLEEVIAMNTEQVNDLWSEAGQHDK